MQCKGAAKAGVSTQGDLADNTCISQFTKHWKLIENIYTEEKVQT
jgi:hypothetical protein